MINYNRLGYEIKRDLSNFSERKIEFLNSTLLMLSGIYFYISGIHSFIYFC